MGTSPWLEPQETCLERELAPSAVRFRSQAQLLSQLTRQTSPTRWLLPQDTTTTLLALTGNRISFTIPSPHHCLHLPASMSPPDVLSHTCLQVLQTHSFMKQFKKGAGTSPLQAPREDKYICATDRMPQSEENQPWGSTGLQIPAITLECEAAEPQFARPDDEGTVPTHQVLWEGWDDGGKLRARRRHPALTALLSAHAAFTSPIQKMVSVLCCGMCARDCPLN